MIQKCFETGSYKLDAKDRSKMRAYNLDPEDEDDVAEYAANMRRAEKVRRHKEAVDREFAGRYKRQERYTYGWTIPPNDALVSSGEEMPYVQAPKITWWTRLIWRLWRWAKRRI